MLLLEPMGLTSCLWFAKQLSLPLRHSDFPMSCHRNCLDLGVFLSNTLRCVCVLVETCLLTLLFVGIGRIVLPFLHVHGDAVLLGKELSATFCVSSFGGKKTTPPMYNFVGKNRIVQYSFAEEQFWQENRLLQQFCVEQFWWENQLLLYTALLRSSQLPILSPTQEGARKKGREFTPIPLTETSPY